MAREAETFVVPPTSLIKLLELGAGQQALWASDELGAILRHQMDAPLAPDLSKVAPALCDPRRAWTAGSGEPLHTFGDLFRCSQPPLELLEATKRFAKYSRTQEEALPAEIATVLYYLAIAVGFTNCGQRITALDDRALQHGLAWVRQQTWLDENSRAIFDEAERRLKAPASTRATRRPQP